MKHIPELDGLRGLAVCIVLLSHTSVRNQAISPYLQLDGIGRMGVYLFFALSAFLTTYPLLEKKLSRIEVQNFYIKRFFRIVPLYYIFVLGIYLYQKLTGNYLDRYIYLEGKLEAVLQHLLFYRGDGVFWTIPVEVQFYLITPILLYLLIKYRFTAAIVIITVALLHAIAYFFYMFMGVKDIGLILFATKYEARSTFIEIFVFSMLAAWIIKEYGNRVKAYKSQINKLAIVFFYGILTLSVLLCSNKFGYISRPFYNFREITLVYSLALSIVLTSIFIGNHHFKKILCHWSLMYMGKLGFSIYLSHMGIIYIVNLTNLPEYVKFGVSIISCIIFSLITFHTIEKPFMYLGKKLIIKL